MFRMTLSLALALSLSTVSAIAHDFQAGALEIKHPYSFATPPTARTGAGYMEIVNTGDTTDRLIDARSDVARMEIHRTETDAEGISRMIHQKEGIELPASETVTFEPGGFHIMFMGLEGPFVTGESTMVTLVFEEAGEIEVEFKIEDRQGTAGAHGSHDGHGSHGN